MQSPPPACRWTRWTSARRAGEGVVHGPNAFQKNEDCPRTRKKLARFVTGTVTGDEFVESNGLHCADDNVSDSSKTNGGLPPSQLMVTFVEAWAMFTTIG